MPRHRRRSAVGHRLVHTAGAAKGGESHPRLERDRKLRIGVLIEVEQRACVSSLARQQFLRHPRHDRRLAAHHQRRDRADADGAAAAQIDAAVRLQRDQRAIEPAGVDGAGPRDPALEHVLAVEMRALAIGRRGGVHDRGLLRLVEPVQVRHRRIEREERIERQRRRLAVEHQRAVAAQADPVGIADRRDRAQAVERAAQDDDEQARIAALGARQPRHLASMRTARRRRAAPRGGSANGGESSCSSPLEIGRHEQQRQRLLAAFGAAHRLRHLGRY